MPKYNRTFELKNSGTFNGVYETTTPSGELFYVYYLKGVGKDESIHFSVDAQSHGLRFHISWPIPGAGINYRLYYNKNNRSFPQPHGDNQNDLPSSCRSQAREWVSDPENQADLSKAAEELTQKVWT